MLKRAIMTVMISFVCSRTSVFKGGVYQKLCCHTACLVSNQKYHISNVKKRLDSAEKNWTGDDKIAKILINK